MLSVLLAPLGSERRMPSRLRLLVPSPVPAICLAMFLLTTSACGRETYATGPSDTGGRTSTGGSGGSGGGGTPAPSTTITVTSSGVSPQELRVPVGSRVTFTNRDNRPHDFSGGPDPSQPECPEIDAAGFVAAGQSRQTGVFATARTCRYHDHAYLGVAAFTGRIAIE